MFYFDSDVWIHSFVNQDKHKHDQARGIIDESYQDGYVISTLNIQEILFVLAKLKVATFEINAISKKLLQLNIENYSVHEIERAVLIANDIGYRSINDCIHTSIAETYCTELITYNKKDFDKIAKLSQIPVRIL